MYKIFQIKCYPLDELGSTSVCVKVELCGINFSDIYTRQGFLRQLKTPRVLGAECYGTIKTLGKDVNNFKVIKKAYCQQCNTIIV